MKRFLSIILAAIMLFTTFPSVVFAAEDSTSECEEFIDLACEIFPEYSDKIRGDSQYSNTNTRSSVHVELIESVSRAVSENEYITYAEYSNGAILLTDYSYSYYTTQNESYTSAGGTYASIDIIAACSGGDSFYSYFELENFCYTLISGNYDRIDSIGSTYCSNRCSIYRSYTPIMNESASGYAQVKYDLRFQVGPTTYYSHYTNLTILVGSNGLKISHVLEV